jgi:hypothetical protein
MHLFAAAHNAPHAAANIKWGSRVSEVWQNRTLPTTFD